MQLVLSWRGKFLYNDCNGHRGQAFVGLFGWRLQLGQYRRLRLLAYLGRVKFALLLVCW